jgi:hypothetical protein
LGLVKTMIQAKFSLRKYRFRSKTAVLVEWRFLLGAKIVLAWNHCQLTQPTDKFW